MIKQIFKDADVTSEAPQGYDLQTTLLLSEQNDQDLKNTGKGTWLQFCWEDP